MGLTLHVECARNYFRKGLAIRPLRGTDHRVPTVAAWKSVEISPVTRRFIDFVGEWLDGDGRALRDALKELGDS